MESPLSTHRYSSCFCQMPGSSYWLLLCVWTNTFSNLTYHTAGLYFLPWLLTELCPWVSLSLWTEWLCNCWVSFKTHFGFLAPPPHPQLTAFFSLKAKETQRNRAVTAALHFSIPSQPSHCHMRQSCPTTLGGDGEGWMSQLTIQPTCRHVRKTTLTAEAATEVLELFLYSTRWFSCLTLHRNFHGLTV